MSPDFDEKISVATKSQRCLTFGAIGIHPVVFSLLLHTSNSASEELIGRRLHFQVSVPTETRPSIAIARMISPQPQGWDEDPWITFNAQRFDSRNEGVSFHIFQSRNEGSTVKSHSQIDSLISSEYRSVKW